MAVSLSGLDLSFMDKKDMKKGRYRFDKKKNKLVSLQEWAKSNYRESKASDVVGRPYFMPDVDSVYGGSWKSIIDGSEISSRSNWREHNKRNGVVDVGDKYWSQDGDDVSYTENKMGYDKSLIGSEDFEWK